MIIVHCPACEHSNIREKNVAYAEMEVLEWDFTDADGLQPTDHDSEVEVEWEVSDEENQYVCGDCRWTGRLDQLVVEHAPDGDE